MDMDDFVIDYIKARLIRLRYLESNQDQSNRAVENRPAAPPPLPTPQELRLKAELEANQYLAALDAQAEEFKQTATDSKELEGQLKASNILRDRIIEVSKKAMTK